jgi:hypothetical protein
MVDPVEGTGPLFMWISTEPTELTRPKDIIRSDSRISGRIDLDQALDPTTIYAIIPRQNNTQDYHWNANLRCSIR